MLRSRRYATWAIRDLNLKDGDEVDYIRGVTTAFRGERGTPVAAHARIGQREGDRSGHGCVGRLLPGSVPIVHRRYRDRRRPRLRFGLLYFGDPEHPSQWDRIFLLDWRELSEPNARKPHDEQIGIAGELLEKEST